MGKKANIKKKMESPVNKAVIYKTAEKEPPQGHRQEWHKKLGMSPPAVKRLNDDGVLERTFLTIETVEERMKADGYGHLIKQDDSKDVTLEQKILYYLYGSEYMWSYNAATNGSKTNNWKYRYKKIKQYLLDKGARERMEDILKNEADHAPHSSKSKEWWVHNQKLVLRYRAQGNSTTIFSQIIPYVARKQLSKNCYLHAVGSLLGYKYMFDNYDSLREQGGDQELKAISVDVSRLIRQYYLHDKLEKRVLENKGGSAIDVVCDLIRHDPKSYIGPIPTDDPRYAAEKLKENGPLLVVHFRTNDHIRRVRGQGYFADSIPQFDYKNDIDTHDILELSEPAPDEDTIIERLKKANNLDTDEIPSLQALSTESSESMSNPSIPTDGDELDTKPRKDGSHSLVIIGHRSEVIDSDQTTKHWFLIQNSWSDLPLFEASHEYLQAHLMRNTTAIVPLFCVKGPPYQLPQSMETHSLFISADFDDGGDEDEDEIEDEEAS